MIIKHDRITSGTSHLSKHTKKCTAEQPQCSTSNKTHLQQSTLKGFMQKSSMLPKSMQDKVNNAALDFIVQDLRPLRAIEGKGFQSLVDTCIEVGAKFGRVSAKTILPTRNTIKRKLDDRASSIKNDVSQEVKKAMENNGLIGVTTDMWSDLRMRFFLGITVHFILNGSIFSRVLNVKGFDEQKKSGVHIRQALEDAFAACNISVEMLLHNVCFVTDEGANMKAALTHYKRLTCACHMLATVLRHTLQLESLSKSILPLSPSDKEMRHVHAIQSTIAEFKNVVAYFKRSGLNNQLHISLKQANETRWNSTLLMLESYLKNAEDIKRILILEGQEKRFEQLDYVTVKCLVDFLQPFLLATKQLESDSKPTINYVYLWFSKLKRCLKPSVTDNALQAFLKERGLAALVQKFQIHLLHKLAFFLNPKFKALVPFSVEEKSELKS